MTQGDRFGSDRFLQVYNLFLSEASLYLHLLCRALLETDGSRKAEPFLIVPMRVLALRLSD